MSQNIVPSPSTNLYESSMSALLSTFKGHFEEDPRPESAPAMDLIVGNFLDSIEPTIQENFVFDHRSASVPLERMQYTWKDNMMPTPAQSPLPLLEDRRYSEYTQYDGSQGNVSDNQLMINRRMSNNTSHHSNSPLVMMENLPTIPHDQYFFQDYNRPSYLFHDQQQHHYQAQNEPKFVSYQHPSQLLNEDRVYHCDFPNCTKEFQKRTSLEQHRNVHLGKQKEKPFQCDKCPQAFARSHGTNY